MKALKITQLLIWGVIAAALLALLLYCLHFGRGFDFSGWGHFDAGTELSRSSYAVSGINKINIDSKSADILFENSDTDQVTVVCYGSKKQKDQKVFSVSQDSGTLNIDQDLNISNFFFFSFGNAYKIEVYLPKSYHGDLDISDTSGDLRLTQDLTLGQVSVSQTSGELYAGNIDAKSFSDHVSSGDIRLQSLSADQYSISSISGDLSLGSLAGGGNLKAVSGDIRAGIGSLKQSLDISAISGDVSLNVSDSVEATLTASCTSGDINSRFPLTYSGHNNNHATGTIGSSPTGDIHISTISGDISIQ